MTALADQHLTDLQQQLLTQHLSRDLSDRATTPELARLTHVIARYHDQIANGFGAPHPSATRVRDGAHRAGILVQQAEHLLGPPADTELPRSPLAQKLRAASIALGCGLDLLSTHFPTTSDQAISANAALIAAPDTARSLLRQLSVHTATLGRLAYRIPAPADQAGPLLLKAAVIARIYSEDQNPPPITAIPVHHTPDRIPPKVGETNEQALAGINASIYRLSNPASPTSITTWRYLARAAAIICDLNTKTIRQLIHRANELNEPDHLSALKQAATDLKYVGITWRSIVRHWDEHIGHYGHPANGPATDASDLIIRLGRLIHTDPAWTPSPRASSRLKPPHQLAPTLAHAARIATITLKTIEACNNLATHHHAAINDAAAIGTLNRQKKYPTHRPRVPASARKLSTRYNTAQTNGRQAITTLSQAIHHLAGLSHPVQEEVNLISLRATAGTEQYQAYLAATEFPPTASSSVSNIPTTAPISDHRQYIKRNK
ncbi:hypothetical protein [Actinomadura latina]|uniref:Uncharacterized protein n=1 Tax=Actinomadura latina TaxID=163603 RepID=A0A846YXF1_9ACTN|nr:hypothetical protein [Actinomadura latina]NKZ03315.1 hypothetical protein [Actinomadura latina]